MDPKRAAGQRGEGIAEAGKTAISGGFQSNRALRARAPTKAAYFQCINRLLVAFQNSNVPNIEHLHFIHVDFMLALVDRHCANWAAPFFHAELLPLFEVKPGFEVPQQDSQRFCN
mmetsp:Transcript_17262/g.21729  ORF Transcript_17262/g.21729 Transcript_17262/m.21729 type:complete len:115 (-) Transcript_17262:367-711(-)